MRHHENTVFGESRDPFRFKGINQHHGGLLHAGSMRQDPSRGHQQVQRHVVDDGLWPTLLAKGITDRTLLLDSRERGGELLVLHIRQPQGFTRDRLLKHQGIECLRDCGGPNHLVFDSITQFAFVAVVGNPPQNLR